MDSDTDQEDLEDAAEFYDKLMAGTLYDRRKSLWDEPGARFIGEEEDDTETTHA